MTTGQRIRAERLRLGLSPEACAEQLGITIGRWEKIEEWTSPQLGQLVPLSDLLGMNLRAIVPELFAAWEAAGQPKRIHVPPGPTS
jgi:transcriptional regulator with XRE-family HTH domain